ncbi:MAG: N(4)-(beta-N-acetylglucosaminyl)-L-asparaginase [Verrucomicrobiales bacterium]|nr:N(4)-(beta-N-acetylglucosaminyl)-L-asparaginase [Verrucomicrobiales bacterium]
MSSFAVSAAVRAAAGKGEKPVVISTWPFGKAANEKSLEVLQGGGSNLDAVEKGIHVTELDEGNRSVGLSGNPNAAGVVQLDACIMDGPGHRAGSVAALEGIVHPISAARLVMEKTRHVMLAGEGARMFALEQGLKSVEHDPRKQNEAFQKREGAEALEPWEVTPDDHDTIALLVLGADGNLAGGCSTSGLGGKHPGRVGDSPILGGGLYVDNEVGAAGATGIGENVMRYCATFMIVEFMRQGMGPEEACLAMIERTLKTETSDKNPSINFVALDKNGNYGGAGTNESFKYAVTTATESRVWPNSAWGGIDFGTKSRD